MRTVLTPPPARCDAKGLVDGGWWHDSSDPGRIICDLCPRECHMKPGDRGFCFVRQNVDGEMKLTTYGRSTGFCIDPIEKKPLNHFLPGTPVLSFGTAGCNLGCKFCQNWDISKSREVERLSEMAFPEMIARAAVQTGCHSVAYTYNDPIIWAEYAIDTAVACRAANIKSVAVTAGYISAAARAPFFHAMDAANVDLKSFSEDFYERVTYSQLQPVLDTLRWLKHESDVWFEITNLIIPDANDSVDEIRQMCDWILNAVGSEVPVHFTAFHPDFRMKDNDHTPHETLLAARQIATDCGIQFVYLGNVHDIRNQSTWCPGCGALLIERDWHQLGRWGMEGRKCAACHAEIPGVFEDSPGTWGRKRMPIQISKYGTAPAHLIPLQEPSTDKHHEPLMEGRGDMSAVTESPQLTAMQEAAIHRAAGEIVAATVLHKPLALSDATLAGSADATVMGTFVTLKKDGQLRGCCGSLGQPMPLLAALTQSATRTAAHDHRFPPVSKSELSQLTMDVTLLFNFETIKESGADRLKAVEVGKHGLKITRGMQSGLLLPIVAMERNWDARTFLDQVCRKAGLPVTAWQQPDSQLIRFEGRMIERPLDSALTAQIDAESTHPFTQQDVELLTSFARANILALFQGAVPGCFPAECSDGTVDGMALQLRLPNAGGEATFAQLQFRGGYPLQTTLLKLTEAAAMWLRTSGLNLDTFRSVQVDLILFADPAMQGTLENPSLDGFDPAARALLAVLGPRSAWRFQQDASTKELQDMVADDLRLPGPANAQLFSFAVVASSSSLHNAVVPRPAKGTDVRASGVAGRFYPSGAPALKAIVTRCLGDVPETKEEWPAVMVPHAGLQYSGHIAGGVLKRIHIPETVIIIGPKHTRHGVEWAVAPNAVWQLPGTTIESDVELARKMAAQIDGLQLDAAAHTEEHCIEVELPLLARLAPNSKVVGVAMAGGTLDACRKFGHQLADLIAELPAPPLLVVSSDMNHFATDDENRRLDEMALQAMESLDAGRLFNVVTRNGISMCGVLPAVVVMEALKLRGQLKQMQRAGYATSADVSGDKSRVVGYAGMLMG